MCDIRSKNEETIYYEAISKPPKERQAYIKAACGDDSKLIARVEALLRAREVKDSFLEAPALDSDVTLDSSPMSEIPGSIVGHFKLLEKIGEGGMAVVYMAEQKQPIRRKVALKIIKLGMDTKQVIARFEAERQALAVMDHPNIAKVLDAGATDSGRPYFAMELVKGISITEYCDRNRLSTRERLELFIPVCNAVHHAHQKGIVHRDLKPSNIMVTVHDGKPVPKVIDFGIAKATNRQLTEKTIFTRYAEMIGTPEYMSPEQAEMSGIDIDTRTDIYSIGIVLYELLTGALPFDPDTLRSAALVEIQRIIREEEPPRPSTRISTLGAEAEKIAARRRTDPAALAKRLYRELEWIPLKAMRKDRTRRYGSASELADDIQNYLNGSPLIAGPESATYRLKKFVQKHRMPLMVTVVVVTSLVVGLFVSTMMYLRAQRALDTIAMLEDRLEADRRLVTAERLEAEGRYEAALEEIKSMLEKQDLGPKANLLKAQLLFEVGQVAEAEDDLKQLTKAEPEIAGSAHYLLARINLDVDSAKADEHKQKAESMLPKTADAYALRAMTAGTTNEALQWLSKALSLDPAHYPSRKARAFIYHNLENCQKMAEEVETLIALRPRDSLGYALRAIVRRESGQYEEALEDHNHAIKLCRIQTEFPELHNQRRETYVRISNHRAALQDARRCASLQPKEFSHRFHTFAALVSLGDFEEARREYKNTIQESPDWHRQFRWWSEKHVFDILGAGQVLQLPPEVIETAPFSWMQKIVDSYPILEERATRLLPGGVSLGSWSPDGQQLAYVRTGNYGWLPRATIETVPAVAGANGIEIYDIRSGKKRLLVTFGYYPAWSPDGKYIAFAGHYYGGVESGLWLIPAIGGKPRRLTTGTYPVWSQDSRQLFFLSEHRKGIYSIRIDDLDAIPEKVMSCPGRFVLSKDETWLAYETPTEIRVVEFPSGLLMTKWSTPWPIYGWYLGLSSDGRELSITDWSWYSEAGMWIYDIKSENAWRIPGFYHTDSTPLWSPDGSKMAISFLGELWLMTLEPSIPTYQMLGPGESRDDFLKHQFDQKTRAIEVDPHDAESYFERALIHITLQQYEKARTDLQKFGELVTSLDEHLLYMVCWWAWRYSQYALYEGAELLVYQALGVSAHFPYELKPNMFRVIQRLISACEAWGKQDLADQWRAKLPPEERI